MLSGFNSFGDCHHRVMLTERSDRAAHRPPDSVVSRAANEGLIDLNSVEGKAARMTKRRIPDSEIIEGDAHSRFSKLLEQRECRP